jgi:hypothetical protein
MPQSARNRPRLAAARDLWQHDFLAYTGCRASPFVSA